MMEEQDLLLFAIGGSGARFLRSLLFQLASGLRFNQIGTIRLVIIDTDEGNGNLGQYQQLLKHYNDIRDLLYQENNNYKGRLFHHPVKYFDPARPVLSPLTDKVQTLERILEYSSLEPAQRDLIDLVLTKDELSSPLKIGFEGRPNMGTIGLQRLNKTVEESKSLKQLMGKTPNPTGILTSQARIFIVSSMFGGMGSSGMPLLAHKFDNASFASCRIGCLSYMPYFRILEGQGTTDSRHFIPRTQIALDYYKKELKPKVNVFYYIGDDMGRNQGVAHAKGGIGQQNGAHYVEFYSISSLTKFCLETGSLKREGKEEYLTIDDAMMANATAYEEASRNYLLLASIARYYTDHFHANYRGEELQGIPWVVHCRLDSFSSTEDNLLNNFFKALLEYNDTELNGYAGMNMIKSSFIPENLSSAIPHPQYNSKRNWIGSKIRMDDWNIFNSKVIRDKDVEATKHVPRLLSIFENSFQRFFTENFK